MIEAYRVDRHQLPDSTLVIAQLALEFLCVIIYIRNSFPIKVFVPGLHCNSASYALGISYSRFLLVIDSWINVCEWTPCMTIMQSIHNECLK